MSSSNKLSCFSSWSNRIKLDVSRLLSGLDNEIKSSSTLQENPISLNVTLDPGSWLYNGSILLSSSISWGSQDFDKELKNWKK